MGRNELDEDRGWGTRVGGLGDGAAAAARVQGSMESVVLGRLALEQRKGYGIVKGLGFIFSATDLVYSYPVDCSVERGSSEGKQGGRDPLVRAQCPVGWWRPAPWRRVGNQDGD